MSLATPGPDEKRTSPYQVLSDTPAATARDDHLDFLPYASALATLIDRKATATPLVAAISAPWGAGKTTLAELVQEQLRSGGDWDESHIICQFNAWKHDDAPHLGAAFAAEVAQCATQHRHWMGRVLQPLPSVMLSPAQRWRRKCYVFLIALYVAVLLGLGGHALNLLGDIINPGSADWAAVRHYVHGWALTAMVVLAAAAFVYPKVLTGTQAVARFVMDPRSEAARGSMKSVRNQLGKLIRSATRGQRRFIIVVDDLERCRPPRAVEICEVASQLLDHEGVVTVLVGDMETIAMSAAVKYRSLELPDTADQQTSETLRASYAQYGRAYLQKIVTLQFDLPPATPEQLRNMLQAELRSPVIPDSNATTVTRTADAERRATAAAAMTTGAGATVATTIMVLANDVGPTAGYVGVAASIAVSVVSVILAASIQSGSARIIRRRARQSRKRIGQAIRQSVDATVDQAAASAPSDLSPDAVRKQYLNAVLDTTGITERADEVVFGFLPARPRSAKRLFNQVRLMLLVATSRGMFRLRDTEDQNRQADLIAKWLVLRERWPDTARQAHLDPGNVWELEQAARGDVSLSDVGLLDVDDAEDLAKLLKTEPSLIEDLKNLLYFIS